MDERRRVRRRLLAGARARARRHRRRGRLAHAGRARALVPPLRAAPRPGRRPGRAAAPSAPERRDQGGGARAERAPQGGTADEPADVRQRVQEPGARALRGPDARGVRAEGSPDRWRADLAQARELHRERRRRPHRGCDRADGGGPPSRTRAVTASSSSTRWSSSARSSCRRSEVRPGASFASRTCERRRHGFPGTVTAGGPRTPWGHVERRTAAARDCGRSGRLRGETKAVAAKRPSQQPRSRAAAVALPRGRRASRTGHGLRARLAPSRRSVARRRRVARPRRRCVSRRPRDVDLRRPDDRRRRSASPDPGAGSTGARPVRRHDAARARRGGADASRRGAADRRERDLRPRRSRTRCA